MTDASCPVAEGAHRFRFVPRIKAAVQGKVFHFSADAVGRFIIKIFGHPNLIADFHDLAHIINDKKHPFPGA
jgi:predicted RNase H-like nuclease